MSVQLCVLCKADNGENLQKVHEKGFHRMMSASIEKKQTEINEQLNQLKEANAAIYVHRTCRKSFVDIRKLEQSQAPSAKRLRSSTDLTFDWKNCCFLCEKKVNLKNRKREGVVEVQTIPFKESVLDCSRRRGDRRGDVVAKKLQGCIDLVAEEAIYHQKCKCDFWWIKQESSSQGRQYDASKTDTFEQFCVWFDSESDSEMYTLNELYSKMCSYGSDVYNIKTFRTKLVARYNGEVYFESGGPNGETVVFRNMTDFFLKSIKYQDKESVISVAAQLIKDDVRRLEKTADFYPSYSNICNDNEVDGNMWVPQSLQLFMKYLVPDKIKRMAINQCIVQASRPRSVIAPVPCALGVHVEKTFGSKSLLTILSRLGFCITSDEVLRFKQSAVEADLLEEADELEINEDENTPFVQWVADNADHNTITLTGKGTFHGMGVISITNNSRSKAYRNVPRLKKKIKTRFVRQSKRHSDHTLPQIYT